MGTRMNHTLCFVKGTIGLMSAGKLGWDMVLREFRGLSAKAAPVSATR